MYDDIGRKIQTLSKVLGILSAIGWFVIAIMNDWGVLLGIVLAVVIFLYSWFGYGFGQLVDDIHLIAEEKRSEKQAMSETLRSSVQKQTAPFSGNVVVFLISVGSNPVSVSYSVATLLGISRTAADFMITDLPCEIKGNISIERAKLIQSQLEALGAVVEIRGAD